MEVLNLSIKRSVFPCILAVFLLLCACSSPGGRDAPVSPSLEGQGASDQNAQVKGAVNRAMLALKSLDMETFNSVTDNRQTMVTPWGSQNREYTLFGELCREPHSDGSLFYELDQEIVKNLSWEILEVSQEGQNAKIKLQVTNLDMEGVFQKVIGFPQPDIDAKMIEEIQKIPTGLMKTTELDLTAHRQAEKWVLSIDSDFSNAISANIWLVTTDGGIG